MSGFNFTARYIKPIKDTDRVIRLTIDSSRPLSGQTHDITGEEALHMTNELRDAMNYVFTPLAGVFQAVFDAKSQQ